MCLGPTTQPVAPLDIAAARLPPAGELGDVSKYPVKALKELCKKYDLEKESKSLTGKDSAKGPALVALLMSRKDAACRAVEAARPLPEDRLLCPAEPDGLFKSADSGLVELEDDDEIEAFFFGVAKAPPSALNSSGILAPGHGSMVTVKYRKTARRGARTQATVWKPTFVVGAKMVASLLQFSIASKPPVVNCAEFAIYGLDEDGDGVLDAAPPADAVRPGERQAGLDGEGGGEGDEDAAAAPSVGDKRSKSNSRSGSERLDSVGLTLQMRHVDATVLAGALVESCPVLHVTVDKVVYETSHNADVQRTRTRLQGLHVQRSSMQYVFLCFLSFCLALFLSSALLLACSIRFLCLP